MSASALTVLRSIDGSPATKRIPAVGKAIKAVVPKHLHHEPILVDDLFSLAAVLARLEHDASAFVIRGLLNPAVDPNGIVLRRKASREGLPAFILPEARPWVMLDLDNLVAPEGMDPTGPEAIEFGVRQLPEEFNNASLYYQFSASAGRKGQAIKLHFWFWLDRPVEDAALKGWAKAVNREHGSQLIDTALFDAVQVHYTAKPIFEGCDDPLPERSGLIRRELVFRH